MKKSVLILFALVAVTTQFVMAQDEALDTRVWSVGYWMRMAELGLVEINPDVTAPPPTYLGPGGAPPIVLGGDGPDVLTSDDPNITQSENSVFVNPTDIDKVINSNNSTNNPVTILYGTSAYKTIDGGPTWYGTVDLTGAGANFGDPAAAIDLTGRYYVGYINTGFGQGVAYSTNGGDNWTNVTVTGSGTDDKNHLWVDNSPSSPHEGNLYSAWTSFSTTSDIVLSRSTNQGLSWSAYIDISLAVAGGSHDQGVSIQTGPNGEVYAAWSTYDCWPCNETAIGFAKSTDGGATFQPATRIITNIMGIRQDYPSVFPHRVNSFPVMAVDISGGPRSGWIYVVWTNRGVPGVNSGNDRDVYMIRSTNGGTSWSTPIRIHNDPTGLGERHYTPWISCDPITGALSAVFYDSRNTTGNAVETWASTSIDGGNTWEDFRISDVSFTPTPIPGLAGGYFGDYLGIASRSGKVYPVWTDNRNGIALAYTSPFQLAVNVGWVEGIVMSGGSPLEGVDISFDTPNIQIPGTSNAAGYYIAGAEVDTGTGSQMYTLQASKFGYLPYMADVTLMLDDTITHNITMATAPGGTLMVHAHTNDGSGIGADVDVLLGGEVVVSGSTDPGTGDYTTPLPSGTYDVIVDPPSPYGTVTFAGVVINANQTTPLDALIQYVLDPSPTELHDTLVVGQIHAETLTLTNTTDVDVPFRVSDDNALLQLRMERPVAQPRPTPLYREEQPKGAPDLRVGPPQYDGMGGPDGFGYRWIDSDEPGGPTYSWVDISSVGTSLFMGDDDNQGPFNLGFDIDFYGNTYNSVRVCSNGWISFTSTVTNYTNEAIPTSFEPNNAIYAFWDDLYPPSGGTIHYYSDVANNQFIVQWTNIQHYPGGTPAETFQIILTPNNEVLYQYMTVNTVTSSTIGIENADGSIALQVVYNASYLHNNLATLFYLPNAAWISESPDAGTIPANSSQNITVTFNASGLDVGSTYNANIFVSATHPDVSDDVIVPASLTTQLADSATLILSRVIVDFPVTPVNDTQRDSVTARNGGATTLNMTSITSNNSEFVVSPSSAMLDPLDSILIYIDYTPTSEGIDTGRVIILSNSQGTPRADIILSGEAIGVPHFTDQIDSLQMDIEGGVLDSIQWYMGNDGTASGDFRARAIMYDESATGSTRSFNIPIEIISTRNASTQSAQGRANLDYPRGTDPPSLGRAPRHIDRASTEKDKTIHQLLGPGVTVYCSNFNLSSFVQEISSFNVETPGTFRLIRTGLFEGLFAGDMSPDGALYSLDYFSNSLVSVDTSDGTVTVIGSSIPLGGETWTGLTYDFTTGTWYGSSTSIVRSTLYTIDPATGTATVIGEITGSPGNIDVSADNTGQLYGYDIVNDSWFSIDKNTGAGTLIGLLGFDANFAQGMDFDPATNICYMGAYNNSVGQGELRTVDITTGNTTLVGAFSSQEVTAMGIPGSIGGWLSVAPTSGTVAIGDSVLMATRFDATDPEIYENPGNYFGEIEVTATNSTLADTLSIPVRMNVLRPPGARLVVNPNSIDYGDVQIYSTRTMSTLVRNIGQTTLDVTNITTDNPAYDVLAPTSFSLATDDTHRVYIEFTAPFPAGTYTGTVMFISNDPLAATVALTGDAFGVPNFADRIDSLQIDIEGGVMDSIQFYMRNDGTEDGTFNARAIITPTSAPTGGSISPIEIPVEIVPLKKSRSAVKASPVKADAMSNKAGAQKLNGTGDFPRGSALPSIGRAPQQSAPITKGRSGSIHSLLGPGTIVYCANFNLNNFLQEVSSFHVETPGTFRLIRSGLFEGPFSGDLAPDGTFYSLDYFSNSLITIDTSDGTVTVIGPSSPFGGESWSGLTYDQTTGTLYGASTNIVRSTLYTVDQFTGTTTVIGELTGMPGCIDVSADNSGQLWAYDIVTDSWYSVDKASGVSTLIGSIGFDANFAQGMDFDPATNICYMGAYNNSVGQGELRTVDVSTGNTTLVGTFPNQEVTAMGIPGAATGQWLSIVPRTGAVAIGDSVQMTARFDATEPEIYENPGSYFGEVLITATDPFADTLSIPVRMYVVPPAGARLTIEPTSLDFGDVEIGGTDTMSVRVRNIGLTTLDVTNITIDNSNFGVVPPTSFSLATFDTHLVYVTFTGVLPAGPQSGTMTFASNDPLAPTVPLSATSASVAHIAVNPESFYFNLTTTDTTRATLTIYNPGTSTLDFSIDEGIATLSGASRTAAIERSRQQQPAVENPEKGKDGPGPGQPPPVDGMGGPDAFGYIWIDSDEPGGPSYEWDDIAGVGTQLFFGDDDNQGPFTLDFNFSYYGNTYNSVRICSNGFISFTSTSTSFTNGPIPSTIEPNNTVFGFWDDLYPPGGGTVHFYADAANDRFVVQWTDIPHFGTGGPYTFQIILKSNGEILTQYFNVGIPDNSCTIGTENLDGMIGLQVVYDATYVHNELAILFSRDLVPWMSVEPTTGTVDPGDSTAVEVRVHPEGLADGNYRGNFILTGNTPDVVTVPVTMDLITGIDEANLIPTVFGLSQNYPNPFNPTTRIKYSLPEQSTVSLRIYNLLGQELIALASGPQEAGYYEMTWDGRNRKGINVGSGVYFYRFEATGVSGRKFTDLKKMLFLK